MITITESAKKQALRLMEDDGKDVKTALPHVHRAQRK